MEYVLYYKSIQHFSAFVGNLNREMITKGCSMSEKSEKKEKVKKIFRDAELKETKHYSKKFSAFVLTAFSVLSCVLALVGFFYIKNKFSDPGVIRDWVCRSVPNRILGALIMIFVCAVQVIVALIPGELVEIAAGVIFGAWGGAFLCLVGTMTGSVLAILLTRKLGRRFVESLYPREKIDSLPILRDPGKRNIMTFIIFLIPGTPKDLVTYLVGLTEMSIPTYILLTAVARFPSIIISTIGGNFLSDDRMIHAVIIFAVSAVISLVGLLIYRQITKRPGNKQKQEKSEEEQKKD